MTDERIPAAAAPGEAPPPGAGNDDGANEFEGMTPEQLRAEAVRLKRAHEQGLREKSNYEETSRRLVESERKLRELTGAPAASTPGAPSETHMQRLARVRASLEQAANEGDDGALFLMAMAGELGRQRQEVGEFGELLTTKESERESLKRIRDEAAQRGERLSMDTARKLLEFERAQSRPRDPQPPPVAVPTNPPPGSPPGNGAVRPKTFSEYAGAMNAATTDAERDELIAWRRANPTALRPE